MTTESRPEILSPEIVQDIRASILGHGINDRSRNEVLDALRRDYDAEGHFRGAGRTPKQAERPVITVRSFWYGSNEYFLLSGFGIVCVLLGYIAAWLPR